MHKTRDLFPYNMYWKRRDWRFISRVIPITIIAMAVLLSCCFANLTHSRAQNRLLQRGIGHDHLSFVLDGVRERAMSSSQPDPIMLIDFPEINRQYVDENAVPYAVQSQLNDSVLLESLNEEVDYKVPKAIRISRGPRNVKEMLIMETYPIVEFLDAEGSPLTAVGDDSNPWIVTAELIGGSGATLLGFKEAAVKQGQAQFTDMSISKSGINYRLMFNLTTPADTTIHGIISDNFRVSERPLGLKLINESTMIQVNSSFDVEFAIWDAALDAQADDNILAAKSWECELSTNPATSLLEGDTSLQVPAGRLNFVKC